MKRVVIVQARMTSSRLPGKVLLDLGGRPVLAEVIRRVRAMKEQDEIVVATTTLASDDPIVRLAEREGVRWFRGDETDVLSRFVGAAQESKADLVVRITADCPLLDPAESDRVVLDLCANASKVDYASNVLRRTYPQGLDTEALWTDTLNRVHRLASSANSREHVTWYIYREKPDLFRRHSVMDTVDNSDLRWTLDTPEDLESIRTIYQGLDLSENLRPYREILAYVRAHPELVAINAGVVQKHL
jgi:spore coat polysaccharide biosynthesis protein SpsF